MSQNYNVIPIDLTVAGSYKLSLFSGVLRMVRAVDSVGALALTALVQVKLGDNEGDYIPIGFGNAVFGFDTELNLKWDAQPGVTAYFFRSSEPTIADVDATPPAQLVVGSLASSAVASAGVVGVVAGVLVAANASRKMLTIYNNGTVDIFLGVDNTVTVANGLLVAPGKSYNTEQYSGAFWAISSLAAQDARIFEEG